ncbi:unnamed protein product, partial [Ectocarpus sp. 13 AM-2016]
RQRDLSSVRRSTHFLAALGIGGTSSMGVISTHPAILLLVLSLGQSRGNIDVRFIAPSAAFEGERFVSSFSEYQTTEDRRSYLQAARERGYTCSMLEHNYQEAFALFCAKTPAATYTDIPKSA